MVISFIFQMISVFSYKKNVRITDRASFVLESVP